MSDPLLEVEDLTIQYETAQGPLTAVADASFTIEEQEYVGLVGESGCGKSTLAKALIGGLDDNGHITSGEIWVRGKPVHDMSERELNRKIRWKDVSYIPQSSMNSLDPLRPISKQAVEIAQTHTDMSRDEALSQFKEVFEIVGLSADRVTEYPHQFSGGMQQRAIIAVALFLRPSLIVADEPTTALDVIMQDQVFDYLDDLRDEFDTALLLITHDISLVFESCEKVAVMHGGQVAEVGTASDLYHEPKHPYSILLQQAFPDIRKFDQRLETISGAPPENLGDVTECTFADRCPWAIEECRQGTPPLAAVDSGDGNHRAACIRMDEIGELVSESEHTAGRARQGDDA